MAALIPEIAEQAAQLSQWRRHLHQHPEPSLKEYETAAFIRQLLTEWGISFEIIGETGTLGRIVGQKADEKGRERTVLLRADIDALEIREATEHAYRSQKDGIMHACGHDAHTTALLGAARYLQGHRDDFAGTVLIAFQQAEEIGAGAGQFVEAGVLAGVDSAFGIHVEPALPLGTVVAVPGATMASCDIFTIDVHGRSSHVARPHEGIDALAAGAEIVSSLQNIVARRLDPLEPAVIGIGKFEAGTRYNIVANTARIEGTLRTLNHERRAQFLALIEETAENVAKQFGATVNFSNYAAAAPNINDVEATERIQRIAGEVVGPEKVVTYQEPSMGSDDFADILKVVPGVYIRVGVSSSPETSYGLHHEKFDLDEAALPIMASLHVRYALDYLAEGA